MKIKIYPIFLLFIFTIIFFLFYKGLQNSNIYTPKFDIKENIPEFETKKFGNNETINSNEIFLGDKFYLMNIWASWCVPCREEHKFLLSLSKKENIEIIGLNYKDKKENAQIFLETFKNPYMIILLDTEGVISIDWGAYGVPETYLIYNKKIIKKIIGPIDEQSFSEIKEIIK